VQIAIVISLGIVVAQLAFIIIVLQAEAGYIRNFLHAIHETGRTNGDLLGMIVRGVDSLRPTR